MTSSLKLQGSSTYTASSVSTSPSMLLFFDDELSMVNNWLKVDKLSLNIKKIKYMIFHAKKKKVQSLTLKIDNVNIERVAELNFLGLTLDEHLHWKCYINKLSNNISQCMGILNKLKCFLPIQTKVLISTLWYFHI